MTYCNTCGCDPCVNPSFCAQSRAADRQKQTERHHKQDRSKRLVVHRASEITPVPVEWLWPGRLAIGKTTLLGGDPGLGKSQLATYIAATVTQGNRWPCQEGQAPKRSVIVLCAEDGLADTIVPRLMAADADREKVRIVTAVTEADGSGRRIFNLSKDLDALEDLIRKRGDVGLVNIDPVDAYLGAGAGGIDSHKNAAVRSVLEPVSELADRLHVAILAITHFSKQGGGKALYRFIGSIAHVGSARVAFAIVADAEKEDRVLMLHAKNNLAPPQKGLAFRLEQHLVAQGVIGSTVYFESEHVAVTADEAMAADRDTDSRTETEEAVEFLLTLLTDGPLPVTKIEEEARAAGVFGGDGEIGQSKPFRRARQKLGIKPYQPKGAKSGGWVWGLADHPPKKGDERDHPHPPHPAHQMPSEAQMPSNKRASDSSGACDGSHQVPPRYQMPSNERASDRARASDTRFRPPIAATPARTPALGPPGDSLDDF
jgi:hypothetical protein